MTNTQAITQPTRRRQSGHGPSRPRIPHTAHLREFEMPDGRKLLIDRRSIGFLCEGKPEEFGGKGVTIVAFRGWAKPIPVVESYAELKRWWRNDAEKGEKHGI